jgi:hypothetical protein
MPKKAGKLINQEQDRRAAVDAILNAAMEAGRKRFDPKLRAVAAKMKVAHTIFDPVAYMKLRAEFDDLSFLQTCFIESEAKRRLCLDDGLTNRSNPLQDCDRGGG